MDKARGGRVLLFLVSLLAACGGDDGELMKQSDVTTTVLREVAPTSRPTTTARSPVTTTISPTTTIARTVPTAKLRKGDLATAYLRTCNSDLAEEFGAIVHSALAPTERSIIAGASNVQKGPNGCAYSNSLQRRNEGVTIVLVYIGPLEFRTLADYEAYWRPRSASLASTTERIILETKDDAGTKRAVFFDPASPREWMQMEVFGATPSGGFDTLTTALVDRYFELRKAA